MRGTTDDGDEQADDVDSRLRRRLLTSAASAGALAAAGCLGLGGGGSETGPRDSDPTPYEPPTETPGSGGGGGSSEFDIEFLNQESTIAVSDDEALLDAGLDEGWDLPYQCQVGVCGQCTAKVDGDGSELVEHDGNQYLDDDQIAEGFVLTCVGTPESEFAIETGMQEEADSFAEGGGSEDGGSEDDGSDSGSEDGGSGGDVQTYDIEYVEQGGTIGVGEDEALLYAGLDEGWDMPYQCEHGVCGQCTSKVDGDGSELVEHDGNQYLSDEQISEGYVLTCVGSPRGEFSLTTGVKDEADEV
jgi:2Fe-2S type ferredoxin